MNPWPFVYGAYALFALWLIIDVSQALLAQRRAVHEVRQRMARPVAKEYP
jgi:heme exporter protein D